jgi:hypothetical protein
MKRIKILFKVTNFRYFTKLLIFTIIKKLLKLKHKDSYSQFAEDLILFQIFGEKNKGNFIDVGCNEPINNNNTF